MYQPEKQDKKEDEIPLASTEAFHQMFMNEFRSGDKSLECLWKNG